MKIKLIMSILYLFNCILTKLSYTRVWNLFVANIACFLQLLVDRLDVLVQVGDGESLATVGALRAPVVVDLPDVPGQVGHGKLFLAMWARLLYLEIKIMLINITLIQVSPTLS